MGTGYGVYHWVDTLVMENLMGDVLGKLWVVFSLGGGGGQEEIQVTY
jgi:hypothetical protein